MKVDVVHIDDCPNWVTAGDRVRAALDALGMVDVPVGYVLLRTPEEASEVVFAGSPTILLDGQDAFASGGSTTDLACRVYMTDTGLAGLPSVRQIEDTIRDRLA
ncbi:hypothetical protein [Microbacterium aerolatum]|uniref:Alkylmercury lyase n=1 Tax=Microbacterium aerolatum TaxID=153731 RepID=A0A511AEW9_9MICO|nr:hypothetical protein [Microbacterium aerolatum]GEK86572.1 hypothetical protein MAE01_17480 [Microbacterium aerolatum]GGB17973.1 hypothetical protein GCM10007198_05660 [Microbacterium aerolatum]